MEIKDFTPAMRQELHDLITDRKHVDTSATRVAFALQTDVLTSADYDTINSGDDIWQQLEDLANNVDTSDSEEWERIKLTFEKQEALDKRFKLRFDKLIALQDAFNTKLDILVQIVESGKGPAQVFAPPFAFGDKLDAANEAYNEALFDFESARLRIPKSGVNQLREHLKEMGYSDAEALAFLRGAQTEEDAAFVREWCKKPLVYDNIFSHNPKNLSPSMQTQVFLYVDKVYQYDTAKGTEHCEKLMQVINAMDKKWHDSMSVLALAATDQTALAFAMACTDEYDPMGEYGEMRAHMERYQALSSLFGTLSDNVNGKPVSELCPNTKGAFDFVVSYTETLYDKGIPYEIPYRYEYSTEVTLTKMGTAANDLRSTLAGLSKEQQALYMDAMFSIAQTVGAVACPALAPFLYAAGLAYYATSGNSGKAWTQGGAGVSSVKIPGYEGATAGGKTVGGVAGAVLTWIDGMQKLDKKERKALEDFWGQISAWGMSYDVTRDGKIDPPNAIHTSAFNDKTLIGLSIMGQEGLEGVYDRLCNSKHNSVAMQEKRTAVTGQLAELEDAWKDKTGVSPAQQAARDYVLGKGLTNVEDILTDPEFSLEMAEIFKQIAEGTGVEIGEDIGAVHSTLQAYGESKGG